MDKNQQQEAAGLIARVLVALRIPANWAKVIAGAIIGAAMAWAALTQSACSGPATADPAGRIGVSIVNGQYTVTRDGRVLTWDDKTNTLWWSQGQRGDSAPQILNTKD